MILFSKSTSRTLGTRSLETTDLHTKSRTYSRLVWNVEHKLEEWLK
jgi:hypothetical protein